MYYCINYSCFGLDNNLLSNVSLDCVTEGPLTILVLGCLLTLSSLSLPLSSPFTTSRELLSQFPTCSEWR